MVMGPLVRFRCMIYIPEQLFFSILLEIKVHSYLVAQEGSPDKLLVDLCTMEQCLVQMKPEGYQGCLPSASK